MAICRKKQVEIFFETNTISMDNTKYLNAMREKVDLFREGRLTQAEFALAKQALQSQYRSGRLGRGGRG